MLEAEIKEALAKVEQAVADERKVFDERIEDLKKTGAESPETKDKLAKAEKTIAELIDSVNKVAKEQERAKLGPDTGAAQTQDLRAETAAFLAMTGKIKPETEATDDQVAAYKDYRAKFRSALRYGNTAFDGGVKAEMSLGSDADGGFFAPADMLSRIQKRLFETSDVRSIATVITTSRNSVQFPTDTNSGESGGWVKERSARQETGTPRVGMQEIETHEQCAEPQITQTLLDDAPFNVEGWLNDKIADILGRTENTSFVIGNGVSKPRGFMDFAAGALLTDDASRAWGKLQYVPLGGAGAFPKLSGSVADDPSALIDVIAKLKPQYRRNARWAMSRSTEAACRKLIDANGRALIGFGDLGDGTYGFLLHGHPIKTLEDMPTLDADTFPIAFGDFRAGYMIVDRIGIRLLRDPYTNKPFVKFYTTKRVGGDVIDFDAIKLVKAAAP